MPSRCLLILWLRFNLSFYGPFWEGGDLRGRRARHTDGRSVAGDPRRIGMGRVSQPEKREKSHGRETASGRREREGRRWEEGGKGRAKEGKKVEEEERQMNRETKGASAR